MKPKTSCSGRFARTFFVFGIVIVGLFGAVAGGIPEPGIVLYGVVSDPLNSSRITTGTPEIAYTDSFGKSVTNTVPLQNLGNTYSYVTELRFESAVTGNPVDAGDVFELPNNGAPARTFNRAASFASTPASLSQGATDSIAYQQKGKLARLDLVISAVDTDGDGMADYWERQYFGNLSRDGTQDRDGDGVSDRAEYGAGTDPNDPQSFFKMTSIQKTLSGFSIRWKGPTGPTYSVMHSTNVSQGYSVVLTGISATNSEATAAIPDPGRPAGFYRIRRD